MNERDLINLMRMSGGSLRPSRRRYRSGALGSSLIGGILGTAVSKVVNEAINTYTESTAKAEAEEAERSQIRMEYNRKMANLPANCPNCGAPTCGKMYCEYCDSKLV